MLKYEINKINSRLYQIKDALDVYMYLVVGDERAMLFDTGYGICDVKEAIQSITGKPLIVVLGHGHIDHANGAYQFDEVYLRKPDFELFHEHTAPEFRKNILERLNTTGLELGSDEETWINAKPCNLISLEVDKVFDLGGIHVKIIDMAGHTEGSIGILLVEERILVDSDSANSHCWMFVPQSRSISEYIKMLKRVKQLDFDVFYVAHQGHAHPKSDIDAFIRVAENASIEKGVPYDNWKELNPYIYTEGDVSIVFNERTLA